MSNLQSDFQASQLAPQNFKNTQQVSATQVPDAQSFQDARSSQLLRSSYATDSLSVDAGSGKAVLGQSMSTSEYPSRVPAQDAASGSIIAVLVAISIFSAFGSYFFFRLYKNLKTKHVKK